MTTARAVARLLVVVLGLALSASPVGAEEPDAFPGEQPETWRQPPSREQADRDPTLVPVGKGALLVPAMTLPAREPQYIVERDGDVIDTVPPGTRAVLHPGIYTVRIGSGALGDRFQRRVLVREGRTTIVPATWSGLVINVVDERAVPFRGSYELVRLPERVNLGLGLGADVEQGEELRTWILESGTYMVIKTGESLQARRDFYTFRLQRGELLRLSVVMDTESGAILGAGQIALTGEDTEVKDWRLHLVLGGDAELNRRSDIVGFSSGYGFTIGGYIDFLAQYKPESHLVYTRFKLEEKQVKFPDQPFQKDLDEMRLDALYVYRVLPWLGPYVRLGFQTQLFPGHLTFDEPTDLVREDCPGGGEDCWLGEAKSRFEVSKPFSPIELRGGVGLSFLITASYIFDANIRFGIGARGLFNRGLLDRRQTLSPSARADSAYACADPMACRPLAVMRKKGDAFQYGLEATLVGTLRLTRWVIANTELEFLEPFDDFENPVVDWETTVGFRFTSFVSLNYIFKLLMDVERSDSLQTEHRILLRFTWRIL